MDKNKLKEVTQLLREAAEESIDFTVHLYEDEVADILNGYDESDRYTRYDESDRYTPVVKWIDERRALGIEPTANDILDWIKK